MTDYAKMYYTVLDGSEKALNILEGQILDRKLVEVASVLRQSVLNSEQIYIDTADDED